MSSNTTHTDIPHTSPGHTQCPYCGDVMTCRQLPDHIPCEETPSTADVVESLRRRGLW
jgi:hypothetical protein